MADLTHIFKVGQKVRCMNDDFDSLRNWHIGTIKEVYKNHVIIDIPEISDHCWYEEGFNLDKVYPEYNFKTEI